MNELEKPDIRGESEKRLSDQSSLPEQARKVESPPSFWRRIASTVICVVVLITLVILGIVVGWEFRVQDIHGETILPENIYQGRTLSVTMGLVDIDTKLGTASFAWKIFNDSACHDSVTTSCSVVNVYFDSFISQAGASPTPLSNIRQTEPIYQYQPYTHHNADLYASVVGQFQTIVTLFPNRGIGSLQDYPFDKYETTVMLFGRDSVTNETVGLFLEKKFGVVVGLEVETTPNVPVYPWPPGAIFFNVNARRGGLVIAYALLIVISVWAITLIFAAATFYSICFGYPQHIEFLAIPVATLFTVTQLRATMPGAPNGFGAIIDYVGLLPCLVIMSLSSVVSIAGMAFTDPEVRHVALVDILRYAVRRGVKVIQPAPVVRNV